jgi:8-oxo-dGTP pyrophosphatase MutT (NUDIX family)
MCSWCGVYDGSLGAPWWVHTFGFTSSVLTVMPSRNDRKPPWVGCILWHSEKKKYLVYYEQKRGEYEFPKGGPRHQDTSEWASARRETYEETGIWVKWLEDGAWDRVPHMRGTWYVCSVTDSDISDDGPAWWWDHWECKRWLRADHFAFIDTYDWTRVTRYRKEGSD